MFQSTNRHYDLRLAAKHAVRKMNICIWFETTRNPWGGSNQFLTALAKALLARGHTVTHQPTSKADVVLINSFLTAPGQHINLNQLAQFKYTTRMTRYGRLVPPWLWACLHSQRKGPVLIHRLDGVAELYRGHRTKADKIQATVNQFADFTIFQSNYCKNSFSEYNVRPRYYHIIYNGVDPDIFFPSPDNPRDNVGKNALRLVASSWSNNPHKGFALLSQFSEIPGVEIQFIGRWCPTIPPKRVILLGIKSSSEIAGILRQSDAMVHAAENEPCSNAILEALACGIPVFFRDSGGNKELVERYGVSLTTDLHNDVMQLRACYQQLQEKIMTDRAHFLITRAAKEYEQSFEQALESRHGE